MVNRARPDALAASARLARIITMHFELYVSFQYMTCVLEEPWSLSRHFVAAGCISVHFGVSRCISVFAGVPWGIEPGVCERPITGSRRMGGHLERDPPTPTRGIYAKGLGPPGRALPWYWRSPSPPCVVSRRWVENCEHQTQPRVCLWPDQPEGAQPCQPPRPEDG